MIVVKYPQQTEQLPPVCRSQWRQRTLLRLSEASLHALEASFSHFCQLNDILAAIVGIRNARDDTFRLQRIDNRVHIAAVDVCPPTKFGLRKGAKRIERSKRGQLVAMSPLHSKGVAHDSADQNRRLIQQPGRQIAP